MEGLLTTCKTCDPSPGRLPLRTDLRDPQWCQKNPIKLPPRFGSLADLKTLTGPLLIVDWLRTSDLCSRREGATDIGPGFPGEGTIP